MVTANCLPPVHQALPMASCQVQTRTFGETENTPGRTVPALTRDDFAEAYSSGYRSTVYFLEARGASVDVAEEVGQAAWVKGWQCLDQLRKPEMVLPWVNSIAKNMLNTTRRVDQKKNPIREDSRMVWPCFAGMELGGVLAKCSTTDRIILHRTCIEGRSTIEVAKQLGLTSINVRVRLHRLRKSLQSQIAA